MKNNKSINPFITFGGQAEEALNFYLSVFPSAKMINLNYFEEGSNAGKVLNATLEIKGETIMLMDIEPHYAVPLSWAFSLLITCDTEEEFDLIFASFSNGGEVMMGPEPVMNLQKVAWVTDVFGVTWQMVWA